MFKFIALLYFGILVSSDGIAISTNTQNQLDFIVFSVNGKPHQVAAEQTLSITWGDRVKVMFARLKDGTPSKGIVNVVGFRAKNNQVDDQGIWFRSDRDLSPRWAVDAAKGIFMVNVLNGQKYQGRVFIKVNQPTLHYALFKVNGKIYQVSDRTPLKMKSVDRIKLDRIEANLDQNDPSFRYQIFSNETLKAGEATHEIRFYRYDRQFATIPVVIE